MAQTYTVRITDKLIRLDATNDDWVVTLLPFVQTPNAPYEIHKTSIGDGHTVTVEADPTTSDFLLSDGSTSITLDDTNNTVRIKIPADGLSPAFVTMSGGGGSGGGGGGAGNVPAPPVAIAGPAEIFFRSNGQVEVDVEWTPDARANGGNFLGVAVYLEDPDISSGGNIPLDGSVALDGTAQASGQWAPVFVNYSLPADSGDGTAVVMLDSTMGSVSGQSYKTARNVRIYLAAYGPYSQPKLVRATDSDPTPNILVEIAQGPDQYQRGMEWAFLISNPAVTVETNYNRPDPNYYLTFTYDPPDPATPLPPGVNAFGGCRIVFVYEDSGGAPQFPGTDSTINVPVAQSQTGYMSPTYTAAAGGLQFRAYFCSEDNSHPLGSHINSLVEGVTPYVEVSVPQVSPAPDVTGFTISGQQTVWLLNGSFVAQATFAWSLPTASAGGARYAGVYLYLVNVTGGVTPLSAFPQALTSQQSNVDTGFVIDISKVPTNAEVWTVAAISVDANGVLADNPAHFGLPDFHSPTVTWNIGPPTPGSPGSGQEYAPLVTINAGAAVTATQSISADGVGMVSFQVGSWTDPSSNQFGAAQVAMVINNDPTKPTYWSVPGGAGSFTTPTMPSFGNIGASVPVDFYIVSDDPQGNKNSLHAGTTPVIHSTFTPTAGAIIPARSGWFDPTQFNWVSGDVFTGVSFSASIIQVGKTLVVGGGPATFGGSSNGQIAVQDSTGKLLAWMGEQQPTQGAGTQIWGGWFGQLWVGGTSPLNAPLWIDNNGIIEVGGIAAAHGATYPYISVRDSTGLEMGRIGAAISSTTDPGGNTGASPPSLTAGAWFTQLAVGGANLTNWNVLITPDATNPLGSNFQMRNIHLLSIDYAAQATTPANNEYKLEFGNSVWMAAGLSGSWQFPGIHIYEIDGSSTPNFGATFISRGMVLRGTQTQGYPVLVSLTAWNGDQGGSDIPANFFGILAMSCPLSPYAQNVVIASGSSVSGAINGNAFMRLADVNGNTVISADTTSCIARAFATTAYGAVIDTNGNWLGKPISGSQTPWGSDIQASGHSLFNAGTVQATQFEIASTVVVNSSATFVGAGVSTPSYSVTCSGVSASGAVNCGSLSATGNATVSGSMNAGSYGGGAFGGAGVNVGSNGIACGALSTTGSAPSSGNHIDTGTITASGDINGGTISVAGALMISNAGIFVSPHGVQTNAAVYGSQFGIYGVSVGWSGTFTSANGKTVTVNGGIITNVA